MNQEHKAVINAMASAMSFNGAEGSDDEIESDVIFALRAAAERGYVLAKLPDAKAADDLIQSESLFDDGKDWGWNACLGAIDVVRSEDES